MRVLLVISKFLPEYASAARRLHGTYQRLKAGDPKLGLRVVCNTMEFAGHATYTYDGISVRRIASRLGRNGSGTASRFGDIMKTYVEAAATWRELKRRDFDVVHVAGVSPSTATAIWWARLTDTPLVIELVTWQGSPAQGLPGLRHVVSPNLHKRTAVIAISRGLGEACARLGLQRNLWVRPNPVDISRFFPELKRKPRLRAKHTPFKAQDRVICAVARIMPEHNQIFLIDVLARLPARYKLLLADPAITAGPLAARHGDYLDRIRARIEELGLGSRVLLHTEVADLAACIKLSDVFCMPTQTEGLGMPVLESLACAVPVIANYDEPAFREWIQDGKNGWCRPLDAAAWADTVLATEFLSLGRLRAQAEWIRALASTEAIDGGYRAILQATAALPPGGELDVAAALAAAV
jgi:glycosyltransferase involved in cell wall biosynthesis